METKNVVIMLMVSRPYVRYYPELINGLNNYRRRGYQIGLRFNYLAEQGQSFELISELSPNYVNLFARHLDQSLGNTLLEKLRALTALTAITGGQSILQQIDQIQSVLLVEDTGFDLVQGRYYEQVSAPEILAELAR